MKKSERQKAIERVSRAIGNGETPDPIDVATAGRSDKGGRPRGKSYKQFVKEMDIAWVYMCARKMQKMTPDEAFEFVKKDMKCHTKADELTEQMEYIYRYCSRHKSAKTPTDPRQREYLEHARAAFEQVEHGYMKLPNHPEYKPRT